MKNTNGLWLSVVMTLVLSTNGNAQDPDRKVESSSFLDRGAEGWSCLDTGKAPASNWVQDEFDDSQWTTGQAPLGYGEEDISTVISFGDNDRDKFPAAFFRRKFSVEDVGVAGILAGVIRADDGAVIYLNGEEIYRVRMPQGEITHETKASENAPEGSFHCFKIDLDSLRKGKNVLAVSVHQRSGSSSDLVLDMEILDVPEETFVQLRKREEAVGRNNVRERRERSVTEVVTSYGPQLDHIAQNVRLRYELSEVPPIRQNLISAAEKEGVSSLYTSDRRLDLRFVIRNTLGNHLSEQQLQDFMAFTQGRTDRGINAVAAQLTAWADRSFSLRPDQRKRVGQALMNGSGRNWLSTQALIRMNPNNLKNLMPRLDLGPNELMDVLSESQARIWKLMSPERNSPTAFNRDPDEEVGMKARFAAIEVEIRKAVEAGRMTREQAMERLEGLRRQLWGSPTIPDVSNQTEIGNRENTARQLAEAKLAAHTQLLGDLDARALRRLALVSKGVVEQYLEAQDRNPPPILSATGVLLGVADPAGQRRRIDLNEEESGPAASDKDITNYPLYQQTIKKVLSEDAYEKYQAFQAERIVFRKKAMRQVVTAELDTRLLLSEKQQKQSEAISSTLPVDPNVSAQAVFSQLAGKLDRDGMDDWQRKTLNEITREFNF